MNINRKMRRTQLSGLPYEERTMVARAQQRAQRMFEADKKLRAHYAEVAKQRTPKWALWISTHVPPKWYIRFFHVLSDNLPPKAFLRWIANKPMTYVATLAIWILAIIPCKIVGCVVCGICLVPFTWLRRWMADFGLQVRKYEVEPLTHLLIIKKFGIGTRVKGTWWFVPWFREIDRMTVKL